MCVFVFCGYILTAAKKGEGVQIPVQLFAISGQKIFSNSTYRLGELFGKVYNFLSRQHIYSTFHRDISVNFDKTRTYIKPAHVEFVHTRERIKQW